ncbi:hypothetical protein V6L77_00225 [Pannonibacter sp. Pt2-lr]
MQLGNVTTTSTGSNSFGVQISGSAAATGMTLTAGTIDAAYGGISAGSYAGFGTVSITTTGDVIGRSQTAIDANITRAGSSLNLDIGGNVSSATHTGIRAFLSGSSNSGNGTMTINVAGTVSGQATGIYADARGGSTLTLSAAGASGGTSDGIRAFGGSGTASITVTGLVQGAADNAGVNYMHSGSGTSTLSLASVQGGNYGAYLFGSGTGATVLSASGSITAASANSTAVGTSMTGNAGALDISVTSLSATLYGAYLGNDGRGATSFTATGPVTVSGANSTGVLVNQGQMPGRSTSISPPCRVLSTASISITAAPEPSGSMRPVRLLPLPQGPPGSGLFSGLPPPARTSILARSVPRATASISPTTVRARPGSPVLEQFQPLDQPLTVFSITEPPMLSLM